MAGVREVHVVPTSCTIEPPFAKPRLEPGQGVLPEHAEAHQDVAADARARRERRRRRARRIHDRRAAGRLQGWTIWETIANTIDDDDLTLYLVLDEAHRGFNTKTTSRQADDRPPARQRPRPAYPPIPIVWGISATIARFKQAMEDGRRDRQPARPAARHRRPGPRAGVRPGQGHARPRHPRRGRQLRLRPRAPRRAQAEGLDRSVGRVRALARADRDRRSRCWCSRHRTRPTRTTSAIALDTIFAEYPGPARRRRCGTCSASTPRRSSARGRSTGSSRSASRTSRTCASSSRRTRSRPAGTARAPRCSCRSGRRRTTPTSLSCSAGWSATRSPAASPATSDSTPSTASCRSSTAPPPGRSSSS